MAQNQYREVSQTFSPLLGVNTVSAPTLLKPGQWRYLLNAYQTKLGNIAKRPGSAPLTAPLGEVISRLMVYRNAYTEKVLATSGTSLYKYASGTLTALTGTLASASVSAVNFTDEDFNSRKLIADGASLKAYNDSTETVSAIIPLADDALPAPPNQMSTLNTAGIKYVWTYSGYVFVSIGKNSAAYSKRYRYDYFPSVYEIFWVRDNDYINGEGISFDNVCLIPMRRGWGILEGSTFDDFTGNRYLNTSNGVIAPRSIARITYPTGAQTIVYLSDDEVYEIYDTGYADTGSRRYSTRCISSNPDGGISFAKLGLSDAEKKAAVGYFDAKLSLYMLRVNRGSERLLYAYDTRNGEWYPWNNIKANDFVRIGDTLYFAGETKAVHQFDDTLASDWNDVAKTTGTPIDWECITDMVPMDTTGYAGTVDYVRIWAKQYSTASKIDVSIVTRNGLTKFPEAVKNQYAVWDVTYWDSAVNANIEFTDLVGKPKVIPLKKKAHFVQMRLKNNRDELCEIYQYAISGRVL